METIYDFPHQPDTEYDEAFEEARNELEKRFGMTLGEYLKIDGDVEERNRKVNRVLQKETLQLRTMNSELSEVEQKKRLPEQRERRL